MRRVSAFLALLAAVLAWPVAAGAQGGPAAPPHEVIEIEGPIDAPLLAFVRERLNVAVAEQAVVVLQLDTPGALDEDGVALAAEVAALPVPVISWVGPVPARASGTGLLLMYASSLAAVSPGSQTGPLTPLDVLRPEATAGDLRETIQGWLDARGKDTDLSHPDEPLTAQQALDFRVAQAVASSVPELLNEVDGTQVMTPGGPVTLRTRIAQTEQEVQRSGGVSIRFSEPGLVRRVQHAVATPSMVYFLLIFGLACLVFEMTQPGFGFAGFSGLALLVLAVYGIAIAPPSWPWMAVLVAGNAALVADVQLRRFGPLTIVGLGLFLLGSIQAYGYVAGSVRISPWLIGGATVAAFLYYGFALTVAVRSRDRILATQQGLIGLVGEARGRLAPDGPVFVKGALWRGRSLGEPIASGSRVRVRGVDGLVLKVEAEPDALPFDG
jgi:membrane-bound serine protease (ClpP class)